MKSENANNTIATIDHNNIPEGWKKVKLGEGVDIGSSKRIFYKEYVNKGIPFYRSKEIIEKYIGKNISTGLFITEEKFNEIKEKFGAPKKGDLLLTSVGTLGIPYVVNQYDKFYFKDGNLTWFKNFNKNLYNIFLYYWILSPIGRNELEMSSIGSTQAALTIKGLKNLEIHLPSLSEQKAIASVLSSIDDKIDLLHRQNKTLEAMAETLFRQRFVPARAGEPHAGGEEAQEDWGEGKLGKVIGISSGKGLKKKEYVENGSYPVLGANGEIGRTDKCLFDEKLIFTGRVGTLGKIFISTGKVWLSDNTLIIKPKEDYFYFVYFLLKNVKLEEYNVGSTQPLIRQSDIKEIEILLPKKEQLYNFEAEADLFFKKMQNNQLQIRILEQLRDALLPNLMSGEVRMKV
ncbi:MAG: restriction endonuclease subunit S [Deltaproteobacteria bacterium]|nr:restriction endonuclease subunit S [Deltaproteobacteria bacterium]